MQRTRPAPRARRKRPAPAPVVVATEIYAVEGELLATMDAVASRRVLKRDIKELTRLVLVGGERPEYGPTGIPNLDRVGRYEPLPADYEAQALQRNANGVPAAAKAYTRVGAPNSGTATTGTAKFVSAVREPVPNGVTNGSVTNGSATNGLGFPTNGSTANGPAANGPVANGPAANGPVLNGHVATNGAGTNVARTPPPAPPAPAPPIAQPAPAARPAASRISNGPLPVARVVDGKVVPASTPATPSVEDDEDLTGSALSAIDAETMFGSFAADAALGGGRLY